MWIKMDQYGSIWMNVESFEKQTTERSWEIRSSPSLSKIDSNLNGFLGTFQVHPIWKLWPLLFLTVTSWPWRSANIRGTSTQPSKVSSWRFLTTNSSVTSYDDENHNRYDDGGFSVTTTRMQVTTIWNASYHDDIIHIVLQVDFDAKTHQNGLKSLIALRFGPFCCFSFYFLILEGKPTKMDWDHGFGCVLIRLAAFPLISFLFLSYPFISERKPTKTDSNHGSGSVLIRFAAFPFISFHFLSFRKGNP